MTARLRQDTENPAFANPGREPAAMRPRAVIDGDWFTEGFAPSPREAGNLPACPAALES